MKLQIGKFNLTMGREKPAAAPAPAAPPAAAPPSPRPQARGISVNTSGAGRQTFGAPSITGKYGTRMYGGAQVSRLTADWPITITSADAEILVSAIALVSRNRQLERDDDYFRQMLWLLENNVVGHEGIKLRSKIKSPGGSEDKNAIQAVHEAWHEFLQEENCTIMGNMHGVELERLCVRCLARDGGLLLRIHAPFDNEFGFALEPIEIDRLDHNWSRPAGAETTNEIQFGLEVDKFKRVQFYHVLTRHPGDVYAWRAGPKYRERIPANEIIYLRMTERCGQTKGMPIWPSVGVRLHHIGHAEESELIACRMESNKIGWFIKQNNQDGYVGSDTDAAGNKIVNVEPGQYEELPFGWDVKHNDPTHPNGNFPQFVKSQLRGAAAGANHPYNAVANDLEGVNYSSIRAGLLDSRDGYKWLQKVLSHKAMRPIFRAWLPYAIMSGKLPFGMSDLPRLLPHRWAGRGWAWVDPLKDVQANLMAIDGGLTSRRAVIAEEGRDVEEVFEEIEEDEALAEEHELEFASPQKPVVESAPSEEPEDKPSNGKVKANGKARFVMS